MVQIDNEMPRPWQRNRLDPEYTARLLSNGCTGMMESAMKKSLDNLLVAEEAGGHGDGNSASMVARKRTKPRGRGPARG